MSSGPITSSTRPYAIVTGDFTPWGGMDRPNYELAWYLAQQKDARVHLVSHHVADPLANHPNVTWHRVPRPLGRHTLGSSLLCRRGRHIARQVTHAGGTVVVNGGNCLWGDVNWIHYIHNLPQSSPATGSFLRRQWTQWSRQRDQRRERLAVEAARLVITDSNFVKDRLIVALSLNPECVRTIYYGIDPSTFKPAREAERLEARRTLGLPGNRPVAAFIGALGHDRRKGFDVLFDAWCRCCQDPAWESVLIVAGTGSELPQWQQRAAEAGQRCDIRFLGFTKSIPTVLAASDALISPTRFEPYGQGVHEALCCGLPAFVTRCAGISERYPVTLNELLLDDPPDALQLCRKLQSWSCHIEDYRSKTAFFGQSLRSRTWTDMASEIVDALNDSNRTPTDRIHKD